MDSGILKKGKIIFVNLKDCKQLDIKIVLKKWKASFSSSSYFSYLECPCTSIYLVWTIFFMN
jgi:hypothetical protein